MSKIDEEDRAAIRKDVEEIVGRVVGEMVGDAMQLISERFDRLEAKLDRAEHRLNTTVGRVDDHDIRIQQLEQQSA